MGDDMTFDPTFDFPAETVALGGNDPDSDSPTMRAYHQLLWSKPLPNGDMFDLDANDPDRYLYHHSHRGEFILSSDRCIPGWTRWKRQQIASIVEQVPQEELDAFNARAENMGGTMIWPSTQVDGHRNINQERGQNWFIVDRLDLTVECIRRHYVGEESPMSECLDRYADFFGLFDDFKGFTDFFLLQDLLTDDGDQVAFFMPFESFTTSRLPRDVDEYATYRANAAAFIEARNQRMINDLKIRRPTSARSGQFKEVLMETFSLSRCECWGDDDDHIDSLTHVWSDGTVTELAMPCPANDFEPYEQLTEVASTALTSSEDFPVHAVACSLRSLHDDLWVLVAGDVDEGPDILVMRGTASEALRTWLDEGEAWAEGTRRYVAAQLTGALDSVPTDYGSTYPKHLLAGDLPGLEPALDCQIDSGLAFEIDPHEFLADELDWLASESVELDSWRARLAWWVEQTEAHRPSTE